MENKHTKKSLVLAACCLALSACVDDSGEPVANGLKPYHGIDVSHHQGKIDWKTVSEDTLIQFVYIKATQGATYQDEEYGGNITQARQHGLKCGSYHYLTMKAKAADQFENFKNTTKDYAQDLIPVVDVELNKHDKNGWRIDGCHTGKNMPQERARVILTLSKLLDFFEEEYGCKPILYCSYASYVQVIEGNFDDYPIFLGNYADQPRINNYLMWQHTDKGHVDGIKGDVDLSMFHEGFSLDSITLQKVGGE